MTKNKINVALCRESALIAEQMCYGASLISNANYARQGLYLQMFFSLSIAFERAAKLIIITNEIVENGTKPNEKAYRQYGHNIIQLFEKVKEIAGSLPIKDYAKTPDTQIHIEIISLLSDFSGNITRYYNFEVVSKNSNSMPEEPIAQWYEKVTLPLFEKHVSKGKKEKLHIDASMVEHLLHNIALVQHTKETGDNINSIFDASFQTGLLEATAPYTRLYVLQICRFFAVILSEFGYNGMKKQIEEIPYFSDFFRIFYNEDSYFKRRKTWKIE